MLSNIPINIVAALKELNWIVVFICYNLTSAKAKFFGSYALSECSDHTIALEFEIDDCMCHNIA